MTTLYTLMTTFVQDVKARLSKLQLTHTHDKHRNILTSFDRKYVFVRNNRVKKLPRSIQGSKKDRKNFHPLKNNKYETQTRVNSHTSTTPIRTSERNPTSKIHAHQQRKPEHDPNLVESKNPKLFQNIHIPCMYQGLVREGLLTRGKGN